MTERLPLFPLGTVLYPGLYIPLQVFEDRYRAMVRDLMRLPERERRFGVVAIRRGREVGADGVADPGALHRVGCVASLGTPTALDDGGYALMGFGHARMRITRLDRSRPYLQADVEVLEDRDETPEAVVLATKVGEVFTEYRAHLTVLDETLPVVPAKLSYLVAHYMVLALPERQAILEAPDAAARLRLELALLRRELALLEQLPSLPAVDLLRRSPATPN